MALKEKNPKALAEKHSMSKGPHKPQMAGREWWAALTGADAYQIVFATLTFWLQSQRYRLVNYSRFARLYGNFPARSMFGGAVGRLSTLRRIMGDRLSFNLVQSVVDTEASYLASNRPAPFFLTDEGDYRTQKLAKSRNKFLRGVFYEANVYEKAERAIVISAINGDHFLMPVEMNGKCEVDSIPANEMWCDDVEAALTIPSQFYRAMHMPRERALKLWPEKAAVIADAKKIEDLDPLPGNHLADLVTIIQAWHPASPASMQEGDAKKKQDKPASDGRVFFCCTAGALTELEPYDHTDYPFVRLNYSDRPSGYWSQGLAEQLYGIQMEISSLLYAVQASLYLAGTFKIWLQTGGDIAVDHINNDFGAIWRSNTKPEVLLNGVVQPEIYAQIEKLKESGYDQAGVSPLAATATAPSGVTAAKAIRAIDSIGNKRLVMRGKKYEKMFVDLGRRVMRVVAEIADKRGGYRVKTLSKGSILRLDWKDLRVDHENEFEMECFPVSSLPYDPAFRMQTVSDLQADGVIDADMAAELQSFPDVGRFLTLKQAQQGWIQKVLDGIVEDGEPAEASVFMQLPLALTMAEEYYARSQVTGIPEKHLDLLRQFMEDVKSKLDSIASAQNVAAPQPAPVGSGLPPPNQSAPGGALAPPPTQAPANA